MTVKKLSSLRRSPRISPRLGVSASNHLIHVSPHSSRLVGLSASGCGGGVEMPGGVLILRRIASGHMTAREAQAQVYPGIAGLYTVLGDFFVGLWWF